MSIPMLAQDKANHALLGAVAACIAANLAPALGLDRRAAALMGSTAAGVAKELLDAVLNWRARRRGETPPHSVELADLLATAAGGLPVALALEA